jgi:hypothetical protein
MKHKLFTKREFRKLKQFVQSVEKLYFYGTDVQCLIWITFLSFDFFNKLKDYALYTSYGYSHIWPLKNKMFPMNVQVTIYFIYQCVKYNKFYDKKEDIPNKTLYGLVKNF